MSNTDGTCEYVLDPDDPETWGGEEVLNEDEVWKCPHSAEENKNLCIFHLPVTDKNDEKVVNCFREIVDNAAISDNSERRLLQFLGANFGKFDLSESPLDVAVEDRELIIDHAEIVGPLNWANSRIDASAIHLNGIRCLNDASFAGTEFEGKTNFTGAEFKGKTNFNHAEFRDNIHCIDARFGGPTDFVSVGFGGKTEFNYTEFQEETYFFDAEFDGEAEFKHVEFVGHIRFKSAVFVGETEFKNADFRKNTYFSDVQFDKQTDFFSVEFGEVTQFSNSEFRRDANFDRTVFGQTTNFRQAEFNKGALFNGVTFEGEVDFSRAEFVGETGFGGTKFEGEVDFSRAEFGGQTGFNGAKFKNISNFSYCVIDKARFNNADLTDAMFVRTSLCDVNFESALLSRAILFGADLRGAKLSGAVFGDVRIDKDTQFLGYPSDDSNTSPHTLSAIRSQPTCVYDPDYEEKNEHADTDKAKSVYRALEELGGKHARPRLQARAFVRRKDLQKQDYWDDATADDATLEERFIAGLRWSRARVARAVLLYGESPWRVIAWSLGIILSFALLYPLGGWIKPTDSDPITYAQVASNPAEILNSVYYSTLTYTALGFGDFQPRGFGRLLTTVETGLGAVLIALLVFVLGRRAAR